MAAKFKKGIDLQGQRATGAADPSTATDLVTKQYADALVRDLTWKQEVVAASTGNVSLTTPGTTLDGVTLAANDRILLKDQTAPAENGIYVWTASGSTLTRATDADTGTELSGATVTVQRGTVNADRVYHTTADDPLTIGTTSVPWVQVGGASSPYVAGNGLTLSGQTFAVQPGNGIIADGSSTRLDPTVAVRKFSANSAATTNPQTFTHGLGTDDVTVAVWEGTELVYPDITKGSGTVIVDWGSAPTASQYRVVIHG
jgi:hypothetical protein